MIEHVVALVATVAIYLLLATSFLGWGTALIRLLRLGPDKDGNGWIAVWLGWCACLLLFQVLHCVSALTLYNVLPVLLLGLCFSLSRLRGILASCRRVPRWRLTGVLLCGMVAVVWVGSRSMLPPTHFDSGLYHFNTVRWINSCRLVPGLGNLHSRLAFNQSYFTYVAALNFSPLFGQGRSIANSFLYILTLCTVASYAFPALANPVRLLDCAPLQLAVPVCVLPVFGYLALNSNGFTSPSPDLTSTVLMIALFILYGQYLARLGADDDASVFMSAVLMIMSVTAVTLKLSNAMFAVVIVGSSLVATVRMGRVRQLYRTTILCAVTACVWMGRGYVLSGAPLYPSTIGYIPFDWAVPKAQAVEDAHWIFSWARSPNVHWSHVLGSWDWLGPWISRVAAGTIGLVYPLLISSIYVIVALLSIFIFRKKRGPQLRAWLLGSPVLMGLLFWFFTAPEPRFATALFMCAPAAAMAILLDTVRPRFARRPYAILVALAIVLANALIVGQVFKDKYRLRKISMNGWHQVKEVPMLKKQAQSGLMVFVPADGYQSWDAPLPCTPYFNERLTLRRRGQLCSGFKLVDRNDEADRHEP